MPDRPAVTRSTTRFRQRLVTTLGHNTRAESTRRLGPSISGPGLPSVPMGACGSLATVVPSFAAVFRLETPGKVIEV